MRVFDLISVLLPNFRHDRAKVHLASWNGIEHPIDEYIAGRFDEWQRWQRRRNFERPLLVSLIAMNETDRWLFAGVHNVGRAIWMEHEQLFRYDISEEPACSELNGRMVAAFRRAGRQPYLNAENWAENILLSEILPVPHSIGAFPGFKTVNLSNEELRTIVARSSESWRVALSNVAGVYLISDTVTGKLYVGSASGEGGIWARWSAYAIDGHGGNVELRKLLSESGSRRLANFRYSILEVSDLHASRDEILKRESHWKEVLMSRTHGHNAN